MTTMDTVTSLLTRLSGVYNETNASSDPKAAWRGNAPLLSSLLAELLVVLRQPDAVTAVAECPALLNLAELFILDIASADEETGNERTKRLCDTLTFLTFSTDGSSTTVSQTFFVVMMVGLEALSPACAQYVIDCLCEIVATDIGSMPRWRPMSQQRGVYYECYSGILNGALYSEVVRFQQRRSWLKLAIDHENLVKDVSCPVIAVGSRKGGTGKSLFLVSTLVWIKKTQKGRNGGAPRCCILDLDLSGPFWQYFLFPKRNPSQGFLDDYIHPDQNLQEFVFPRLTAEQLSSATMEANCPFNTPGMIGHLGIRDVPGVNRTISLAAELNRQRFYPFLVHIVTELSKSFDFVLIDNSPGFEGMSYASMALACSVPKGASLVFSTPTLCDLAGTFLELADYRLANISRSPIWIINKSTPTTKQFTSKPYTAAEVARALRAFDGVLPETPLLNRILKPCRPSDIWTHIDWDSEVADFLYVDDQGRSKVFNLDQTKFAQDVAAVLQPVFARFTS